MKRVVDVLYGLTGVANATRFGEFKTDLFANGSTPAIVMDTAVATGFTISGATTTGILISGATTTGISITAVCGGSCIDFGPLSITTGSLIDYTAITGKVSGYLFNGTMTTSVLSATFIADDFTMGCAHDGLAADTLRLFRRVWSGAVPNGTAAANFIMAEFGCTATIGTDATETAHAIGLKADFGSATFNDDALTVHGFYADMTGTDTKSVAVYGISIDGGTSAINIVDASDVTYVLHFNEAAGCAALVDVDPEDTPSDGGLGATGHLSIDIGGTPYYIPIFDTLVT